MSDDYTPSADDEREAMRGPETREEAVEAATWALIEGDTDTSDRGVSDEHYRERRAEVERVFPILAEAVRAEEREKAARIVESEDLPEWHPDRMDLNLATQRIAARIREQGVGR